MNIDRDSMPTMLRSNGQDADADQTRHELADRVDTDEHAGFLGKFGLNPAELIAKITGGQGGIGGALGKSR